MNDKTYNLLAIDVYCFADDLAQALMATPRLDWFDAISLVGLDPVYVVNHLEGCDTVPYAAKRIFQQTLGLDPADSTMPWPPEDESADESLDHPTDHPTTGATRRELQEIVGSEFDLAEKLLAELDMDLDGVRCVIQAVKGQKDNPEIDANATYVRGVLEPMMGRFAAYIQVARMLDEGIR